MKKSIKNNYRNQTINGVKWNTLLTTIAQVISYGSHIVLIRLIEPSSFGLIAIALSVFGFADLISNGGLRSALIQSIKVKDVHFSSVFWVNIIFGITISILFYFLSSHIAFFFNKKALEQILQILAINFFFVSAVNVPFAVLEKKVNFKIISSINLICTLGASIVAIFLALNNWGVHALVSNVLVKSVLQIVALVIFSNWRPMFKLEKTAIDDLKVFGAKVSVLNIVRYLSNAIDDILIGKFYSSTSLGYYSKAYEILMTPLKLIKTKISVVIYPIFSSMQGNIKSQRELYLKICKVSTFLLLPISVCLFSVTKEFVHTVYGIKWIAIIPYVKIFCLGSLFTSIGFPGMVLQANNKIDLLLKVTLFTRSTVIILILYSSIYLSIYAVVLVVSITLSIHSIVLNIICLRFLKIKPMLFIQRLAPFCVGGVTIVLSNHLYDLSQIETNLLLSLILKVILGGGIYIITVHLFDPYFYRNVKRTFASDEKTEFLL